MPNSHSDILTLKLEFSECVQLCHGYAGLNEPDDSGSYWRGTDTGPTSIGDPITATRVGVDVIIDYSETCEWD